MIFKELDVEEQKKKQQDDLMLTGQSAVQELQKTDELTKQNVQEQQQLLEGGQLSMVPVTEQQQQEANSEKTAVKAKVMGNIPASLTFDDMRRELAFAQYKVGKEEGTRTKHSKSMTKVLDELEAMDFVYDTPVDLESFESQMKFMEDRYHHLIESCREYEKSHRPWTGEGQARKERIRKIREKATEELGRLKENAESFRNTMSPDAPATWRDVIRDSRRIKYKNNVDGVKVSRTSGNTSTVHVLEKDGQKLFFKERAPQIKYGRDLSCRNVAATRLAEFLGVGDCVVKSQNAKLEVNGKEMDGIVMEEAKGEELYGLVLDAKSRKSTYSMKACKKLLSLQVFDVITGQTDRHLKNILGQVTKNGRDFVIDDVTGIDSDMSFGNLCWDRLFRNPNDIGAMRRIVDTMGRFTLPAMSKELADQILALDYRTLQYLLGDLLEPDEITSLNDRLTGVQGQIEQKMKAEEEAKKRAEKNGTKPPKSVFLETDEEWAEFMERAKKNPNIIEMTYMKKECL